MRRFCLRKMRLFKEDTSGGSQKRRAVVYREALKADCGCLVRFRPPGLTRDSTLDRIRAGDEPVFMGQPGFAEELRRTRRAGEPTPEGSIAGRGRGGRSTGALPGLVYGQQGEDRSAHRG